MRAEIDLSALVANYRAVSVRVAPQAEVMAMVKADAYGHGATLCARALAAATEINWFGVALPEEAESLRAAGIRQRILSLGGFWKGQKEFCLRENVTPVIYNGEMAEAYNAAARDAGIVAPVHVKIDTGMGRLGVRWDGVIEFVELLKTLSHLQVEGVMTHFAAADEARLDAFTALQIERYNAALEIFRARGIEPHYIDLANSAATYAFSAARGNLVRVGGAIYGLWRDMLQPKNAPDAENILRPVMNLRSCVTHLKKVPAGETLGYGCTFRTERESLIATLPIGYGDGLPRALSNRGQVIVNDKFTPIVGRVSMDLTLIDVTDVSGVEPGTEVLLLGEQGDKAIYAEDLARLCDTISYEITCGITARVPRTKSEPPA